MNFYEKLRALRKQKRLSQEDLAECVGVSRQAVAKWETGQAYPDVEKLIVISRVLQASIDQLVKEDEDCGSADRVNTKYSFNEDIIDFLCRAKKVTYAGKGAESPSSRPGSHDLQYQEGPLLYLDTYLGGEKFAGEEALWLDKRPFWSMNYLGRIVGDGFSGDFLNVCSMVARSSRGLSLFL